MTELVRLRAARRRSTPPAPASTACCPLMDANFLETNPSPVKAALAADGPDPRRAPAAAGAGQRSATREALRARARRRPVSHVRDATTRRSSAELGRFAGPVAPEDEAAARAAFVALKAALNAGTVRAAERGPDGQWRANAWVKAGILLGFRLGRITAGGDRRPVSRSTTRTPIPLRQRHRRRRRPDRARRLRDPRRLLRGAGRRVHAADVHQRRRLRGRGHDGRLARAGRLVRADRPAGAPLRGGADRRRARARGRAACHHRGRGAGGRELRRLRGHRSCASAPCSHRGRFSPAAPPCSTWCTTGSTAATAIARSRFPRGAVVVPGTRPVRSGPGQRGRDRALRAGHREVPRREDRHRRPPRGAAALSHAHPHPLSLVRDQAPPGNHRHHRRGRARRCGRAACARDTSWSRPCTSARRSS